MTGEESPTLPYLDKRKARPAKWNAKVTSIGHGSPRPNPHPHTRDLSVSLQNSLTLGLFQSMDSSDSPTAMNYSLQNDVAQLDVWPANNHQRVKRESVPPQYAKATRRSTLGSGSLSSDVQIVRHVGKADDTEAKPKLIHDIEKFVATELSKLGEQSFAFKDLDMDAISPRRRASPRAGQSLALDLSANLGSFGSNSLTGTLDHFTSHFQEANPLQRADSGDIVSPDGVRFEFPVASQAKTDRKGSPPVVSPGSAKSPTVGYRRSPPKGASSPPKRPSIPSSSYSPKATKSKIHLDFDRTEVLSPTVGKRAPSRGKTSPRSGRSGISPRSGFDESWLLGASSRDSGDFLAFEKGTYPADVESCLDTVKDGYQNLKMRSKRLDVFKKASAMFMDSFKTYSPVLQSIQDEYEGLRNLQTGLCNQLLLAIENFSLILRNYDQEQEIKNQVVRSEIQDLKDMLAESKKLVSEKEAKAQKLAEELEMLTQATGLQAAEEAESRQNRGHLLENIKKLNLEKELLYEKIDQKIKERAKMAQDLDTERSHTTGLVDMLGEAKQANLELKEEIKRLCAREAEVHKEYSNDIGNVNKLKGEVAAGRNRIQAQVVQINSLSEKLTTAQNELDEIQQYQLTPRPQWDAISDHQYTNDTALAVQMLSNRGVAQQVYQKELQEQYLTLYPMTELIINRRNMEEFLDNQPKLLTALGSGNEVPKFLRHPKNAMIRNRRMLPSEALAMLQEFWLARTRCKDKGNATEYMSTTLGDFMYEWLKLKYGVKSVIMEWSYSLMYTTQQLPEFSYTEWTLKLLQDELPEALWYDMESKFDALLQQMEYWDYEVMSKDGPKFTRELPRSEWIAALQSVFGYKTDANFMRLIQSAKLAAGSPEGPLEGELLTYMKLFVLDPNGQESCFAYEARNQAYAERMQWFMDVEDLAIKMIKDYVRKMPRLNPTEEKAKVPSISYPVTPSFMADLFADYDPDLEKADVVAMMARGFRCRAPRLFGVAYVPDLDSNSEGEEGEGEKNDAEDDLDLSVSLKEAVAALPPRQEGMDFGHPTRDKGETRRRNSFDPEVHTTWSADEGMAIPLGEVIKRFKGGVIKMAHPRFGLLDNMALRRRKSTASTPGYQPLRSRRQGEGYLGKNKIETQAARTFQSNNKKN